MLKKLIAAVAVSAIIFNITSLAQAAQIDDYFYTNQSITEIRASPQTVSSDTIYVNYGTRIIPLEVGAAALGEIHCVYDNKINYIDSNFISCGIPGEEPKQEEELTPLSFNAAFVSMPKLTSLGIHKVTTYCSCTKCCGKNGGKRTAANTIPTKGRTVGCNWLPFGTRVAIEGHEYTVEDRGSSKLRGFDIFWGHNHHAALHSGFGRKIEVFLIED